MKKSVFFSGAAIVVLLFVISVAGCSNGLLQSAAEAGQAKEAKNLQKYNYVFRAVDMEDVENSRFINQIKDHEVDLEKLAGIFSGPGYSNARSMEDESILPFLAQSAVTAYTTPEVLTLLCDLAADGIYIQFAYKEFLIDQCEDPVKNRSAEFVQSTVTKNVVTFNGDTVNPSLWKAGPADIKLLSSNSAGRNADGSDPGDTVTLTISKDRKEAVEEYFDYYADILLASPDSEITQQPDGTYLVENGDLSTTIELDDIETDNAARGFWKSLKKLVKKVTSTVKKVVNHPVFKGIKAVAQVVSFVSGAGVVTLPVWLVNTASGVVTATNAINFFL